jgi:hypothetical protein
MKKQLPDMSENSICIFTTIRATLADTLDFTYYHLNIGADHIFLFFDDPDDPSVNVLCREKRVTCIKCTADHWTGLSGNLRESDLNISTKQEINSRVALKMAREQGYSWICQIDSDELIHAAGGFKEAIASIPLRVDVARFPVLEAIPEKLSVQSAFKDLRYFKHAKYVHPKKTFGHLDSRELILIRIKDIIYRIKRRQAILLGCNLVSEYYIKGHRLGKSIARANACMVLWGPHFPFPNGKEPLNTIFIPKVKILHYDAPDYEHWKAKWQKRYLHAQNGIVPEKIGPHRMKHYEEYVRVCEQGNEKDFVELFKTTYFISSSDRKILQKVGLVSEIHLSEDLFRPVPNPA